MKEWFSLQRDCDPQVENHWLRDIERRETRRMLCHERRGKGRTRDATTISSLSTWWDLESSKVLPEKFNQEERTHSECGEHHPIGWNSRLNKKGGGEKVGGAPAFISLCFLSVTVMWQLSHPPAAIFLCHSRWHPKTVSQDESPFSLYSFCQVFSHNSEKGR